MGASKPLVQWVEEMEKKGQSVCRETGLLVVSVVGKDASDGTKVDEINEALKGRYLDTWTTGMDGSANVVAYFSLNFGALFLVVNTYKDASRFSTVEVSSNKEFFDWIEACDSCAENILLTAISLSHLVLFVENSCRLELSLPHTLQRVNAKRMKLLSLMNSSSSIPRSGRFAVPRFLFLFHRNLIRQDLGVGKRRELLDKLEQNLEDQTFNVFKHYKLLARENDHSTALGHIWGNGYIFLAKKAEMVTLETIMARLLNGDTEEKEEREKEGPSRLGAFLELHIKKVREKKKLVFEFPSQSKFIGTTKSIIELIDKLPRISRESELIERMTELQKKKAIEKYLPREGKTATRVLSRTQHDKRLASTIRSLECLCMDRRDWTEVRNECENLWSSTLKGCEMTSLLMNNCRLAAHPTVGDETVERSKWQLHSSSVTYISACNCARSQMRRDDPFTLKEANMDFYSNFACCKTAMEVHEFVVAGEGKSGVNELLAQEEEWPEARIVGKLGEKRVNRTMEEDDDSDCEDERNDKEEEETEGRSYLDNDVILLKDPLDEKLCKAIDDLETRRLLVENGVVFTEGVHHSEFPSLPPLFPSWSLLCIGTSSVYSHVSGIRGQYGFIGDTHLLPVDVYLEVDVNTWTRDMNYVESTIKSNNALSRVKRGRKLPGTTERVKLFVGAEYECGRGHRQLYCPSEGSIVETDLPLFQPCSYRKTPCENAQLMRLHVVTPKAPVTVTLDPKVEYPSCSGQFGLGESAAQLAWSRYYILRFPWVYGTPSGVCPRPPIGVHGSLKSHFLAVTYTPLANWM